MSREFEGQARGIAFVSVASSATLMQVDSGSGSGSGRGLRLERSWAVLGRLHRAPAAASAPAAATA